MTKHLMDLADAYVTANNDVRYSLDYEASPKKHERRLTALAEAKEALVAAVEAQAAELEAAKAKLAEAVSRLVTMNLESHGWKADVDALQAKLSALESQEPVAWMYKMKDGMIDCISPKEHAREEGEYTVPLYAAPVAQPAPQQEPRFEWTVFNGAGAAVIENITKASALEYLSEERIARGWNAVGCEVIDTVEKLNQAQPVAQPTSRPATRDEKIVNPGVYVVAQPAPDCRTCEKAWLNHRGCSQDCTNGDKYQPAPKVVLWRTE